MTYPLQFVFGTLTPELSRHEQICRTPQPGDLLVGLEEQSLLPQHVIDRVGGHVFELEPQVDRLIHCAVERPFEQNGIVGIGFETVMPQLVDAVQADERIATANGVVEKLERLVLGQRQQPQ